MWWFGRIPNIHFVLSVTAATGAEHGFRHLIVKQKHLTARGINSLVRVWMNVSDAGIDLTMNSIDLTKELDNDNWVNSKPEAWCNAGAFDDIPVILKKAERYFRWQVSYSHRELEGIIRRKLGEDIGTLINIIPLKRGVSGRLMEIEIQGSKRNIKVQRELNIRRILSPSYLYSACFSINVEYGDSGRPLNFIFKGAGWGHGVGMCQVGAGIQAAKKRKYTEILNSYYPGTTVKKIYGE